MRALVLPSSGGSLLASDQRMRFRGGIGDQQATGAVWLSTLPQRSRFKVAELMELGDTPDQPSRGPPPWRKQETGPREATTGSTKSALELLTVLLEMPRTEA